MRVLGISELNIVAGYSFSFTFNISFKSCLPPCVYGIHVSNKSSSCSKYMVVVLYCTSGFLPSPCAKLNTLTNHFVITRVTIHKKWGIPQNIFQLSLHNSCKTHWPITYFHCNQWHLTIIAITMGIADKSEPKYQLPNMITILM